MFLHVRFFHAHSFPFATRTKIMTRLTKGINVNNAIYVLLPIPQIQFKRKAPQLHFLISGGTLDSLPIPETYSISFPMFSPMFNGLRVCCVAKRKQQHPSVMSI